MKALIVCFLLILFQTSHAAPQIETIQINHRPADDLLAEIQPFVSATATVRAANSLIIIKAEPQVISQIKQLINKLDTPPQQIRISVLQTDQTLKNQNADQRSAKVILDENAPGGELAVRQWSTQQLRQQDHSFQVQTVTGKAVAVELAEAIASKTQRLVLFSDGRAVASTQTHYLDITNGFQALARVLPNHQVVIDIISQTATYQKRNQNIRQSRTVSRISGPLGQWLPVGTLDDEKMFDQKGTTRYHSRHHLQQTIYIKVDLL